ncbi:hypothetical protein N7457_002167 [Penicillium paradoxum]|uniref:uncharacterized protein n=1 Tax=Penicillium paradoxum TaxID=176176 RepID=UPI002546F983|nr:uncharacterized protein N7457_002167 [Penicillium paradoxum]KAJ5787177.1 hypothetical protein N7457_002167 [Penicillium paradoxum]
MDEDYNFPQNLLDRLKATQHTPSRNPTARYVFRVNHTGRDDDDMNGFEEVDSEEEMDSENEESRDDETTQTFDTLQQANDAALAFFARNYEEYLDQQDDMSNWYEEGTSEEMMNEVIWSISAEGELSLRANDAEEGFECEVRVSASRVR